MECFASKWDQYVYSYVPKQALETILAEGLYGGEALLKRPDLLEMAAKGRGLSPKEFKKNIENNLNSWSKDSSKGPNVVFHLIPESQKLSKKHPTKKFKLIPVKINLTGLLTEYPDTKIYGMELKPYSEDKVTPKDRYHFLNIKDINEFLAMSAKELWSRYNDIEDKGLYAPDVPHASIQCNGGIIPAKYIQIVRNATYNITKKADSDNADKKISHTEALEIINAAKERIKKHDALREVFEKHGLDIDEVDNIPVCFSDVDVSARTEKGIIYLNWGLLEDGFPKNDHYLAHEMTHFAQQTTGDGPTKGSTDDTYLDNEFEQEGFQVQTKYISETKGDETAKQYIGNVLDYHDVNNKKERKEKFKQLLQLAGVENSKQLKLKLDSPQLGKTKEQLLAEYDEAVRRGPQTKHERKSLYSTIIPHNQRIFVQNQLRELMKMLEQNPTSDIKKRLERKKEMLQLALGLD